MKTLVIILIPILFIGITSCKKVIYGCTDQTADNYSTYANKDDGSCFHYVEPNIPDEVVISNIVYNVAWNQGSTYWYIDLQWAEITSNVLNNGAVSVYARDAGNDWIELPMTLYLSSSYSSTISASYSLGEVSIVWEDSDGTLPLSPPILDFKLVVFK